MSMLRCPVVTQNPYEQQFPPQPAHPAYPTQVMAPQESQKTNGFAIASLIFGIVALSQIKKRNEKGRGMAIAGLSLSGAWVVLICLVVIIAGLFSANGK